MPKCPYCDKWLVESTILVESDGVTATITKVAYCTVCNEQLTRTITFSEELETPFKEVENV